jgi:hypothetical protein
LTRRGRPSRDAIRAVTRARELAQELARIQSLEAAQGWMLEFALTRAQELETELSGRPRRELAWARERAQALAQELMQAETRAKELESERTRSQVVAQQLTWRRTQTLTLADELAWAQEQVQERAEELANERAQQLAWAQELEWKLTRAQRREQRRALALERDLGAWLSKWEQPPPRLSAVAFAMLQQLIRAPRSLWSGVVRSLVIGRRVVAIGVRLLPIAARTRYENEWCAELEILKQEEAPLLGVAVQIAMRAPWTGLVLRTGAWTRSQPARRLMRLEPLWVGLGWAAATLLAATAGIFVSGESPTDRQIAMAVAASLLTGMLTGWKEHKDRRARKREPWL